jgi:hypothetical protein
VPLVRIGYKRLYNSLGCSLQSDKPVEIDLPIADMSSHVYMGLNPTLGISASSGSRYVVLGQSGFFGSMAFGREDVSKTRKLDLLTEICCTKEIEVDTDLAAGLHSGEMKAI